MAPQELTPQEIFNKHAISYQEHFMDLDLYNETYDALCESLKRDAAILEIGCGPGNITKYLLTKRPDLKILAIDIAENMLDLARQNCPTAEFQRMDARHISVLDKKFDAIVCGFCIPYLNKEEVAKLINYCASRLNNKGILYLSVIEDSYERSKLETGSNGKDACFIYYYEENDLNSMLTSNQFGSFTVFRKKYPKAATQATHFVIIARKQ